MPLPPPRRSATRSGLGSVHEADTWGRTLEIIDEVTLILASITFLWGSISFYPGWLENVQLGDILFIVGSFVFLSKSLLGIRHSVKLHGWAHISTDMECFAEFFEHFCYVASSFVFTVGCVLFWPGLFGDNEEHIVLGEYIASLCFIVGSMGFVVASFFNSVLLSKMEAFKVLPPELAQTCYNLACWGLLCSQLGSVLFVTGSFMYEPGYNAHCRGNTALQRKWEHLTDRRVNLTLEHALHHFAKELNRTGDELRDLIPEQHWCSNIMNDGTLLYIAGSCLYLLQSLFHARISQKKYQARDSFDAVAYSNMQQLHEQANLAQEEAK